MEEHIDPYVTPAHEPPAGVHPNFIDPPSMNELQFAPVGINIVVSTVAVSIRLYTKYVLGKVTHDDWFLIFSAIANIPQGVLYVLNGTLGVGAHQWNVRLSNLELILEYSNYIEILWCLGMMSVKYTVLVTIQDIFNITRSKRDAKYWLLQALIWTNFVFYIAITLATIFQCLPREAIWNPMVSGRCVNISGLLIATPVLNLISDALMLTVPFTEIGKLKLPLRSKVKVGAVFAVAILTVINCALRIGFTVLVAKTDDFTGTIVPVTFLANTEYMLAILCACLPLFPRFYKHVRRQQPTDSASTPSDTHRSPRRYKRDLGDSVTLTASEEAFWTRKDSKSEETNLTRYPVGSTTFDEEEERP